MATDAILVLAANVAGGLGANEGVVAANLDVHLPFIGDGGRELGRVGTGRMCMSGSSLVQREMSLNADPVSSGG